MARDDDEDVTLVNATLPKKRDQGAAGLSTFAPIPLAGSDTNTNTRPAPPGSNALELGALGMSNRSSSPREFEVPTRPGSPQSGLTKAAFEDEPIPLLDADDILDIDADDDASDAATIPGIARSSLTRPVPQPLSSTPLPLPLPVPLPAATPTPAAKTPSFLEELPAVASQHDATTRFNRNVYDHDDLPGVGDETLPAASVPTRPAGYVSPQSAPQTYAASPSYAPTYANDLPQEYTAPSSTPELGDLPQWAPVDAAVVSPHTEQGYGSIELESDLPGQLPASLDLDPTATDAPSDLPTPHYSGTNYTQNGYDSTEFASPSPAPALTDLPSDFGAELPPFQSSGDDFPSELPPIGETTQVHGEPRLELDGDLPTPAYESEIALRDDLPTPSTGAGDIGLDLPQPRSVGADSDGSVPLLMDAPPSRDDTQVVRDERAKKVDDAAHVDGDAPSKKKRGGTLRVAAFLAILVAGGGVLATMYPEYVPFQMPWVTPITTDPPSGPTRVPTAADTPTTPATPATAIADGTDSTAKPDAAGEPSTAPVGGIEADPVVPALTAANVNQLDYVALREATTTLAGDAGAAGGASNELVQWARFRLAYRYGDQDAREALLADAPVLSPQASELTSAAAIGVQLLQGKTVVARKNAERLAGPGPQGKARFKDSVAMLLVLAASHEKPPFKAVQIYDRALAVDPKAIDARIGRLEAMMAIPKPEMRNQALADAIAFVKAEGSANLASVVRLATAAQASDGASALENLTTTLSKVEQGAALPTASASAFGCLLAHRAAIAGDLTTARRAAELSLQGAPDDLNRIMTLARLTSASGTDPETTLQEARGRVRDVEGKATLIDEQVKLALVRNDMAAAKKALAATADLAPRPAMPFVKLGEARIALAEGNQDAARLAATAALRMRPKAFDAKLIVLATSKVPPAGELAQLTALSKQGASPDVDVRLAKVMTERLNPGGAAELYTRALWREPIVVDPVGTVIALADAVARSGNPERAEALLEGLAANVGTDARLGSALIAHARRNGKSGAAVEYFQAASAKNPNDMATKLQLARAYVDADKTADAQALLEALVHTDEGAKSPDVLRELGRAWMIRDSVKARSYVNDAIRLKPDAASYQLLGEIEESQTKYDDAIDAYRKSIKLDSANNDVRVRLARVQIQRGQWQDAATQLRDIVQHDPSNIPAMELLGDAMRDLGKPREALVWYKRALDVMPDSATLMMKFARLQLQDLAAVQPAVKSFRRVLQVHPDVAEAHYYLGYALKDMGKFVEAKSELELYLKERPEGEFAAEVRSDLQDLAGQ